jgi:hypothetical protein
MAPDSLSPILDSAPRVATRGLSLYELFARERMPLPSHQIEGGNFRRWAVAVCDAEVKHRAADFARCERVLGVSIDRSDEPNCEAMGQFPHEAHAAAALNWLSHLQAHETTKRAPFDFIPWTDWRGETRAAWIKRRRYLWDGFLNAVRAYQAAKSDR